MDLSPPVVSYIEALPLCGVELTASARLLRQKGAPLSSHAPPLLRRVKGNIQNKEHLRGRAELTSENTCSTHSGEYPRRVDAETLLLYRMPVLLAHALEQEIGLPVARLLVLVLTEPQLFELAPGRGLEDGLKRLHERFSGPLGQGPRLPRECLLSHFIDGLFCSHVCPSPSVTPRWGPP